jgi:hypothetical protein
MSTQTVVKEVKLDIAESCSAFEKHHVVGAKVLDHSGLFAAIKTAIAEYDRFDEVDGELFLELPLETRTFVRARVGKATRFPQDYVVRRKDGLMQAYLLPEHAAPVDVLVVIVFTAEAYLANPKLRDGVVVADDVTHVITEVLPNSGLDVHTPMEMLSGIGGDLDEFSWLHARDLGRVEREDRCYALTELARESVEYRQEYDPIAEPGPQVEPYSR